MNQTNEPWLVLARGKRHYFKNVELVKEFIFKNKGRITGILYNHKLISDEYRIYCDAMRLTA